MPAETSLAICSFIFGGIFERLPHLRVLFAHAGGSFPATVGRVKHGYDCRPDLCAIDCSRSPTDFLKSFWVDNLTHSSSQLSYVISLVGADRVCFGTDYPFPLGECYPLKKPAESIDALCAGCDINTVSSRERSDINTVCPHERSGRAATEPERKKKREQGLNKKEVKGAMARTGTKSAAATLKSKLLGSNALEWLGLDAKDFLDSPHRATKLSEDVIASKIDTKLVGQYRVVRKAVSNLDARVRAHGSSVEADFEEGKGKGADETEGTAARERGEQIGVQAEGVLRLLADGTFSSDAMSICAALGSKGKEKVEGQWQIATYVVMYLSCPL